MEDQVDEFGVREAYGFRRAFVIGRDGKAREYIAEALRRRGCTLSLFEQVGVAEAALKAEGPDLIVISETDESMLAFCRRVRTSMPNEAVTVLAAVPAKDQDLLPDVVDAGVDDYFLVPLQVSRFNARLDLAFQRATDKIERSRVAHELAVRMKQQGLVAELGQMALAGAGLPDISDRAAGTVAEALGVEYTRVLAFLPEEGVLRMTAGRGWKPESLVDQVEVPADERWQAGYTLLSSEPVITLDAIEEGRFDVIPMLVDHGVTSSISVAIPGTKKPYGVLSAHTERRRTFSPDDISFMQLAANVIAAVAEHEQGAAMLGRSEARADRLAAVASRTINGVIITDAARRIEWVNEGFTRITGYTLDEVRGKVPGDFLQGTETDAETIAYIREQLSKDEGFTTEIVNYRKSGEKYWVRIEVQPLLDEAGRLTGYMAIETDVTEQRAAEQALRESEARSRAILETTVDAIITIDVHGRVESFNSAAERIFQYTAGEVIGRNVKMLMPSPYFEEHDGYLSSYLETGRRKIIGIGREVTGLRKDSSTFPMELAVSDVRLGDRTIFTGIIRDISDRRRLENEILEISEQERRRIGQDLHDGLGQMLTGISLISKNLERRLRDSGAREADAAAEITELMKEADQHARSLARGLVPVELDGNGLSSALHRLVAQASRLFSIHCSFEHVGSPHLEDNTVATHLYRIAQEAVSNAVKHGMANRVAVTLATGHDRVRLRIHDNGSGFPDSMNESQGMGVRIMHYRARIIGGTLDIRDHADGGAVVTCTLRRNFESGTSGSHSPMRPVIAS